MIEQLELTDWKQPADQGEIDQLVRVLSASGTWLTAAQITEQIGWCDRKIRKLASESDGLIISGNSGYKHTKHATPEELREFYGRMVNQGREMIRRAVKAKRVHHAHIG
ncbi:MAG TPA: hypothetical protein VF773_15945 [Verrucomicrobiae bacterium]